MAGNIEILLPLLAAIFAYLSWKRIAMGNAYEREEVLRNRLKDSAQETDYYQYQLGRVQIAELGGWGYSIWKYLPIVGGVRGETLVYLYFGSADGGSPPKLVSTEEISSHLRFEDLPISSIEWKEGVPAVHEEYENLEMRFETIDPDEITKAISDISGIMMDINSDGENSPFRDDY